MKHQYGKGIGAVSRYIVVTTIAWVMPTLSFVMADNVDTKRDRYLLLDSRIIEMIDNVHLTVGTVQKDKNNPLFKDDNKLAQGELITKTVTDAPIQWKDGFSFEKLKGKEIKLSFELRESKLYSFSFQI